MPQMSPMNWLMILINIFILIMFISVMLFFVFNYKYPKNSFKKTKYPNWKW